MKKTRKFLLTFLFTAALTVSAVPCRTEAMEQPITSEEQISPRTDNVVWIYKTINEKQYRRLYNKSQNKWIGDWDHTIVYKAYRSAAVPHVSPAHRSSRFPKP